MILLCHLAKAIHAIPHGSVGVLVGRATIVRSVSGLRSWQHVLALVVDVIPQTKACLHITTIGSLWSRVSLSPLG